MLTQKVLGDARFFLERTPLSSMLDVHLYMTARPATKAPVTAHLLTGRSCTAAPNV